MAQQSGAEPGREYSAVRREALTLPMDRPRANDAREEQQTREDTQGDSAAGKLLQADPDSEGRVAARDCRKGYTGGLPVGMGFSLGEVECSRTR